MAVTYTVEKVASLARRDGTRLTDALNLKGPSIVSSPARQLSWGDRVFTAIIELTSNVKNKKTIKKRKS